MQLKHTTDDTFKGALSHSRRSFGPHPTAQRIIPTPMPPSAILSEVEENQSQSTPQGSTSKSDYIPHKTPSYVPVRIDWNSSFVFPSREEQDAATTKKIMTSVTHTTYKGVTAPPVTFLESQYKKDSLWQMQEEYEKGMYLSENRNQFADVRKDSRLAAEYLARQGEGKFQKQTQQSSHFRIGNEDAESEFITTSQDHHGNTATLVSLLEENAKQDHGGIPSMDEIRRQPIVPDHSFECSLKNTIGWDEDRLNNGAKRIFSATTTNRNAFSGVGASDFSNAHYKATFGNFDHLAQSSTSDPGDTDRWVSSSRRSYIHPLDA
jgi:hypothetical protein